MTTQTNKISLKNIIPKEYVKLSNLIVELQNKPKYVSYKNLIHQYKFLNLARNNSVIRKYIHHDKGHPKLELVIEHVKNQITKSNREKVDLLFRRCIVDNDPNFNKIEISLTRRPAYDYKEIEVAVANYEKKQQALRARKAMLINPTPKRIKPKTTQTFGKISDKNKKFINNIGNSKITKKQSN